MAFGLSAAENKSEMIGSDVAVAYIDGYLGYATDYNITAKAPVSYCSTMKSNLKKYKCYK